MPDRLGRMPLLNESSAAGSVGNFTLVMVDPP
jgi:hypothetical protein